MNEFRPEWSSTPRPSSTCPISRRTGRRHQDQRLRLGERGRRGGGGGADTIVMISTDKAIDPVSMLGATKRFAEMYGQALDAEFMGRNGATRIIAVRFGNVLGSVGSVVPKFKAQIARGGPITVTHPDMVRYFMTTREAADLVLTSASHAEESRAVTERSSERASVYVLKMGQPVRIYELERDRGSLAGYEPGEDIEIAVTGHAPRRAPARDPLRPRGAAHRDRHRRRHGRQARLRRPRPGRRVAPGSQPAIREGDRPWRNGRSRRRSRNSSAGSRCPSLPRQRRKRVSRRTDRLPAQILQGLGSSRRAILPAAHRLPPFRRARPPPSGRRTEPGSAPARGRARGARP